MNNGAFGENFPYSNFHDLNMDWIIKIAKDFLDQYTNIQNTISDGEENISELTETGLTDLQNKADNLESLLQDWYDTHSSNIADELASALADINNEYGEAIHNFEIRAEQIAEQTSESIPQDYTDLSNSVRVIYENNNLSSSTDSETPIEIIGLTLGKTLTNGVYTDSQAPNTEKRAASKFYYNAGDYIDLRVASGYKVELDFYDDSYNYVIYKGWFTADTIVKSLGKYFRILVGGDSSIENVYNNIATIYIHSNLSKVFDSTNSLIDRLGSLIPLDGWVNGWYPNPASGSLWEGSDYKYAPMVDIIGGAKYLYTGTLNSACGIVFYDKNRTLISGAGTSENEFTAPANACFANIGALGLATSPALYCIGYDWAVTGDHTEIIEFTQISGVQGPSASTSETGAHASISVKTGEKYIVSGYTYVLYTFPLVVFFNDNTYISSINGEAGENKNVDVIVPENANIMIVNGRPYQIYINKKVTNVREGVENLYTRTQNLYNFEHKTIVWYGTSIPANGWFGYEHPNAYPQQVGKLLDAEVINEAIGSSAITCKDPSLITENNPYGFNGNFESCSRCFTNTIDEMQWIIDHYDSSIWTSHAPESMDSWLADQIKNCSYERKLDKYLTTETMPDLFVFDHGFNDSSDIHNYYSTYGKYTPYCFRGGMNFLIKRILDFNPYANIIIIGNYTTTRDVPEMQETVANDWGIPIYKQWEYLGLSITEEVSADGYWNLNDGEYEWVTDGTVRTYSVRDRLVPDHIHPWINPTGKITKKMAQLIAKWISTNVIPYINE